MCGSTADGEIGDAGGLISGRLNTGAVLKLLSASSASYFVGDLKPIKEA